MPIINAEITETINISQNGTYNVAKYTTANIGVPTQGLSPYTILNGVASKNSSVLTGNEFDEITEIADYGMQYAFYHCNIGGVADLSSVQTIGTNGLEDCFSYSNISEIDLSGLTSVSEKSLYYACRNCANLKKADVSNLETISAKTVFTQAFYNSGLTEISFDSLREITTDYDTTSTQVFYYAFYGTKLKLLAFPSLTTIYNDHFSDMLKYVDGCTVMFPSALENTITSFQSYTKSFGGTNINIVFGDIKKLPINLPSGWKAYGATYELVNGEYGYFFVGDNYIIATDGNNHFASIDVVVTNETTEFTFDPTQIVYNTLTLQSDVVDTTFIGTTVQGTSGSLTKTFNNVPLQSTMYFTDDYYVIVLPEKEGYLCAPSDTYMSSSQTLSFNMSAATVVTYNATDLLSALTYTSGADSYYSADNDTLVVHTDVITSKNFSGALMLPSGISMIRINGSGLVDSEANYDFGYLYFDTSQKNFTASQIKADNSDNVVFKQSGLDNVALSINKFYSVNSGDQYYLTIGWAQDSSVKGANTMWVEPITITYA